MKYRIDEIKKPLYDGSNTQAMVYAPMRKSRLWPFWVPLYWNPMEKDGNRYDAKTLQDAQSSIDTHRNSRKISKKILVKSHPA